MTFYISDNQDITRAGLLYVISALKDAEWRCLSDKAGLLEALKKDSRAIIIIDYTLFDINDAAELNIISERFPDAEWILFSEDLSHDFLHEVVLTCPKCGIVLKDCSLTEIKAANNEAEHKEELPQLTKTEQEILKDIALGMTTKEIAKQRFSSFHTINTHRKNIFRKLGVNNLHEATKFAFRAGLIDAAEYYI